MGSGGRMVIGCGGRRLYGWLDEADGMAAGVQMERGWAAQIAFRVKDSVNVSEGVAVRTFVAETRA